MSDAQNETYGWNPDMKTPLLDKLKADLKQAMLEKNVAARSAIRQIMAEFPKLTVPITLESGKKSTRLKKPEEITDDDVIGIIRGLAKSEQTVLEATGESTSAYLDVLRSYLPKMVEQDEIVSWIKNNIDFSQFKNRMQAMGPVMKHFGKLADGKLVNKILKEWK